MYGRVYSYIGIVAAETAVRANLSGDPLLGQVDEFTPPCVEEPVSLSQTDKAAVLLEWAQAELKAIVFLQVIHTEQTFSYTRHHSRAI